MIVGIREAQKKLSELISKVCQGEDVVIARRRKLLVRLIPVEQVRGPRQPGVLKGNLRVGPEFFEPLPKEELFG